MVTFIYLLLNLDHMELISFFFFQSKNKNSIKYDVYFSLPFIVACERVFDFQISLLTKRKMGWPSLRVWASDSWDRIASGRRETEATEADRFCRVVRIRFSLRREPQMDGTLSLVVHRQSRVRLSANVRRPKEMEKKDHRSHLSLIHI